MSCMVLVMEEIHVGLQLIQPLIMIRVRVVVHVMSYKIPRLGIIRVMLEKFVKNVTQEAKFPLMHAMMNMELI